MKKIKVSVGRTINMGNFESNRLEVGIEQDIPDKSDDIATIEMIQKELDDYVSGWETNQKS